MSTYGHDAKAFGAEQVNPHIIRTDSSCIISGASYPDLPVIINKDGSIHEVITDYLRHLAVNRNVARTSVNEYAKVLGLYLKFLAVQQRDWTAIDDSLIRHWRNWMAGRKHKPVRTSVVNGRLGIVFGFYWWAELSGYIKGVIGQSDSSKNLIYPLSVDVYADPMRPWRPTRISCPLTYRTARASDDRNPTEDEISRIHVALGSHLSTHINERDSLIASWAEIAMLRRKEVRNLLVTQLPSTTSVDIALRNNSKCPVKLVRTKGEKVRVVTVDPYLIKQTHEYIFGPRAKLIDRFRYAKGSTYRAPKEIFLSEKTGLALVDNAISNIFTNAKRISGVSRGNVHRLRSVGATELVENLIDYYLAETGELPNEETLLLRAKEELGHSSSSTTKKHYIKSIRRRQERNLTTHDRIKHLEVQERLLTREIERKQKLLERVSSALNAPSLVPKGHHKKITP